SIKRGKPFSFSATASNQGPDNAAGIELIATITGPHGALIVTDPDCAVDGERVSCVFGSLAVGAGHSVLISGVGTAKGQLMAKASVTSIDTDPNLANNTATAKIRVR
ncbi:MAG: DUF11 domain-containing protein, partial [Acidimicrobiia bacterium]|nr:DUF11 domain-containing protein [Acidimicrobiia bacterium]